MFFKLVRALYEVVCGEFFALVFKVQNFLFRIAVDDVSKLNSPSLNKLSKNSKLPVDSMVSESSRSSENTPE